MHRSGAAGQAGVTDRLCHTRHGSGPNCSSETLEQPLELCGFVGLSWSRKKSVAEIFGDKRFCIQTEQFKFLPFLQDFWKGKMVHFSLPLLHSAIRRNYHFNVIYVGFIWNWSHKDLDDCTCTFSLLLVDELARLFTLRHPEWTSGSLGTCSYGPNGSPCSFIPKAGETQEGGFSHSVMIWNTYN